MIKLFKKVASWFGYIDSEEIPKIKIQKNGYYVDSNSFPFNIDEWILVSIKDRVYIRLKEDPKLLKRVNDFGFINVEFVVTVPLGISVNVVHTFYWDGEYLYSMTQEYKQMNRSYLIDSVLNK